MDTAQAVTERSWVCVGRPAFFSPLARLLLHNAPSPLFIEAGGIQPTDHIQGGACSMQSANLPHPGQTIYIRRFKAALFPTRSKLDASLACLTDPRDSIWDLGIRLRPAALDQSLKCHFSPPFLQYQFSIAPLSALGLCMGISPRDHKAWSETRPPSPCHPITGRARL